MMFEKLIEEADNFLKNDTEFHLGGLPTEQSHPVTRNLSATISQSTKSGVSLLQRVDHDIEVKLPHVFASKEWKMIYASLCKALADGKKICFSGCGATGRVSILLEAAYRKFLLEHPDSNLPDTVYSIMTGGDYALVRSVESFEDYVVFGRKQVLDLEIGAGDILVAITEGGETSSVIGTAWQALENGAKVFFVCNNPLDILAGHVKRSREIIDDERIIKLDLSTGPMAIAGSTRLQATTIEILAVGVALEMAMLSIITGNDVMPLHDYVSQFSNLLKELESVETRKNIAEFVELEQDIYSCRGAITYFAEFALLDIFTDTTERAPTFMLPPFRKWDDEASFRSWTFVKNPVSCTQSAWEKVYQRKPRCLEWTASDYKKMQAAESIIMSPPALNVHELHKFRIGNEDDPSRYESLRDIALLVLIGDESETLTLPTCEFMKAFNKCAERFSGLAGIAIGEHPIPEATMKKRLHISCSLPKSLLGLWEHLATKLVLNTVSTATMARMGRITGNWMACVETTNKKLIDRGTRLVSELADVPYEQACRELFITRGILNNWKREQGERPSPVAYTIARLKNHN